MDLLEKPNELQKMLIAEFHDNNKFYQIFHIEEVRFIPVVHKTTGKLRYQEEGVREFILVDNEEWKFQSTVQEFDQEIARNWDNRDIEESSKTPIDKNGIWTVEYQYSPPTNPHITLIYYGRYEISPLKKWVKYTEMSVCYN